MRLQKRFIWGHWQGLHPTGEAGSALRSRGTLHLGPGPRVPSSPGVLPTQGQMVPFGPQSLRALKSPPAARGGQSSCHTWPPARPSTCSVIAQRPPFPAQQLLTHLCSLGPQATRGLTLLSSIGSALLPVHGALPHNASEEVLCKPGHVNQISSLSPRSVSTRKSQPGEMPPLRPWPRPTEALPSLPAAPSQRP